MIAPSRNDPNKQSEYWTPCSPGDPSGVEMTWMNIQGDELLEPMLSFVRDFFDINEEITNAL